MLRDPALIPLSHQHQHGLALCVLVRRSLAGDNSDANIRRLAQRVVERFDVELVNHFEVEEQVLFPAVESSLVAELIHEHRRMEAMVEHVRAEASAPLLENFAALLSAHIRREENELFEEIQRQLPRERLVVLGREIERRTLRICL